MAIVLFGLPQSIVHSINHKRAMPAALALWGRRYASGLLLLTFLIGALSWSLDGKLRPQWLGSDLAWVLFLTGSVGWVYHGLQRVFALCLGGDLRFAVLSAVPSVSLLVAVVGVMIDGRSNFEVALFVSSVVSVLMGAWLLQPLRLDERWERGTAPQWHSVLGVGLQTYTQTFALAVQPWVSLQLMLSFGATSVELGQFALSSYVYQAIALPASFLAPSLFVRVSRSVGAGSNPNASRWLKWALLTGVLASLCGAIGAPEAVNVLFGGSFAPAATACVWMALCAPALLFNRLATAVMLGWGRFAAANGIALLRVLLLLLISWVCLESGIESIVTRAAMAWFLVEALCAGAFAWIWWRAP